MSNRLLRAAFLADCGSIAAKAVLVSLADMANDQGSCFPSIETTATRISADEKTVRRAVRQLIVMGHISVDRRGRGFQYSVHPQCGQKVRDQSGQKARNEADILSKSADAMSGHTGQKVHSLRAESPANHQEPSLEPSTTTAAVVVDADRIKVKGGSAVNAEVNLTHLPPERRSNSDPP